MAFTTKLIVLSWPIAKIRHFYFTNLLIGYILCSTKQIISVFYLVWFFFRIKCQGQIIFSHTSLCCFSKGKICLGWKWLKRYFELLWNLALRPHVFLSDDIRRFTIFENEYLLKFDFTANHNHHYHLDYDQDDDQNYD